jgi:hypothetical protein
LRIDGHSFRAPDRSEAAVNVAITELRAVVITEVKLGKEAMLLFTATLIDTLHALLKQAEVAFRALRIHVAANVFASAMADSFMRGGALSTGHRQRRENRYACDIGSVTT